MATCAVCLQEIVGGQFVLSGTEVVHRRRTCLARLSETVAQRQKILIAGLQHQLAQLRLEMESRLDEQANRVYQPQIRELRKDVELAERNADTWRDQARTATDKYIRAQGEISTAQQLAAAARREADLYRTMNESRPAPAQPATPAAAPATPPAIDERDPTEVRFSLLELEPLK